MQLGKTVYDTQCASCHGAEGAGKPPHYPPLAGNQSIQMASAVNPIRMVLNGGYPPGTAGNPHALRHAAVRADPVRRRGRRRRHLHPHRLGQPRHAGHARARPTSCARRRWIEDCHDQLRPPTSTTPTPTTTRSTRSSRAGPRGAIARGRHRHRDRRRDLVRVLLPRVPAARRRAMSDESPTATTTPAPSVAARVERRWATVVGRHHRAAGR